MDDNCPWCGVSLGVDPRNIRAYESALEEHVPDCEPWLKENGGLGDDD